MKETALWGKLRPQLNRHGKFQKICDRFTGGIPDVLGCAYAAPWALELKEFSGVRKLSVSFRPGQLDWLRDWERDGRGHSRIVATHKRVPYVFHWSKGAQLEEGVEPSQLPKLLLPGTNWQGDWESFVTRLLTHKWRSSVRRKHEPH